MSTIGPSSLPSRVGHIAPSRIPCALLVLCTQMMGAVAAAANVDVGSGTSAAVVPPAPLDEAQRAVYFGAMQAVAENDVATLAQVLSSDGANASACCFPEEQLGNFQYFPPLHVAVAVGRSDSVRVLLQHGARQDAAVPGVFLPGIDREG